MASTVNQLNTPSLSVIIPAFNAEPFLHKAICSILASSISNLEIVVVDDGSKDKTAEVAATMAPIVRVLRQERAGACAARNFGLKSTTAPFLSFLDADDYFLGGFLETGLNQMQRSNALIGVGPLCVENGREKRFYPPASVADFQKNALAALLRSQPGQQASFIFHRDVLPPERAWPEEVSRYQDLEFLRQTLRRTDQFTTWDTGAAVWSHCAARTRLSQRVDFDAVLSQVTVLNRVQNDLKEHGLSPNNVSNLLGNRIHRVLRQAARSGSSSSYLLARAFWLEAGAPKGRATKKHRIAAKLFGLRLKEKLATLLNPIAEKSFFSSFINGPR